MCFQLLLLFIISCYIECVCCCLCAVVAVVSSRPIGTAAFPFGTAAFPSGVDAIEHPLLLLSRAERTAPGWQLLERPKEDVRSANQLRGPLEPLEACQQLKRLLVCVFCLLWVVSCVWILYPRIWLSFGCLQRVGDERPRTALSAALCRRFTVDLHAYFAVQLLEPSIRGFLSILDKSFPVCVWCCFVCVK